MKDFKTADPADMTHGDLSKRVHYLKCEEGGIQVVCEMSDKWVREGIEIGERRGEMKAKREAALRMAGGGTAVDLIAGFLDVSVGLVKQWLEGKAVLEI